MERIEYSTTGNSRLEFPTIETSVGTMAYWRSIQFVEHGHITLGGFEPPYTGQPGEDKSITVNRVEYSGSITVMLWRDGRMVLDFSSLHRVGDWRARVSDAAKTKLEAEFLPLAKDLFPMPSQENLAAAIYRDASSRAYSYASSGVHKISGEVYRDERMAGFAEVIRAGVLAGLDKAKTSALEEHFHTSSR